MPLGVYGRKKAPMAETEGAGANWIFKKASLP